MNIPNWRAEWKTIPNLLSIFRLILLPIYLLVVINAKNNSDFYLAGGIMALSGLTDLLDGYIARRFNQITELGKLLDPVADKITQLFLILSMAFYRPILWWIFGLFIVKELFMMSAGIMGLKNGIKLDGAKWFGKISTAVLYLGMILLLLFPKISTGLEKIIILLIVYCLVQSFVLYGWEYYKMFQQKRTEA